MTAAHSFLHCSLHTTGMSHLKIHYSCLMWNLNMSMLLLFKLTTVKMSKYKYKGNLHNVLIHTAIHLIL